ncbi:protein-export chaperone SecB [Allosphingosinicella indica]|uniref:Protein-export protein SecB n=1 Tax=Allosphingosinicella indica TaxID=941907 RepID=A0A1X7FYP8_9SPHN|nr:protein-export chaperone SecB [Allosphingosinicella indica]SMF61250.1 protein translocase subunit secB [Allosphingosinicella indica]
MAEEQGAADVQANGADNFPQVGLISQYVKDLSFENPNAPAVFQWQSQPQIDVQFNISVQTVGEELHEVTLKTEINARAEGNTAFQVEIAYAGLFGIRNLDQEQMQPFLLAEAPRLLFPFARRVIADAVRDGGFPPLMIDPIDFHALYLQRAGEAQGSTAEGAIGGITGQA